MRLNEYLQSRRVVRWGELERKLQEMSDTTVAQINAIREENKQKWQSALDKISALETAIGNQGAIPPEVQTALDALKADVDAETVPA